ncbi:PDR/VanB family oxidoreductase [Nocardia sp. NPDC004123]
MTSLLQLRINKVIHETDAVASILFESPDGQPLPQWSPGAHIEIILPSGKARQYSLCGDPNDRSVYEIAVLREDEGRGGSVELHRLAQVGEVLGVREPRNNFQQVSADHYLFLAGGIGITPILPMIAEANAAGANWRLVYGGRSRTSMAFLDRLSLYDAGRVDVVPQDEKGFPALGEELEGLHPRGHVYCCGPTGMINAVTDLHVTSGRSTVLHVERFAADPDAVVAKEGAAFEVQLARTGAAVPVGPSETILDAIRPVLTNVPFSCGEGYCGSCETTVLAGEPDHRDTYLTDDEKESNDTMMICVSRSNSTLLKLDL